MSTSILTTTIHVPTLLRDYAKNALDNGHNDIEFVIVGDRKTPAEVADLCDKWQTEFCCRFTYMDPSWQIDYLKRFPRLAQLIPWNSHQRRNVGLLYSIEQGHSNIITIDDDNFILPGCDFIGDHCAGLGEETLGSVTKSATGWFNCIAMMRSNYAPVYPRGFPLNERWKDESWVAASAPNRPVVNAGLWCGDPDIDAMTRIYRRVETSLPLSQDYVTLARRTWCPINTQNTAIHRSAAPAAFMVVMGYEFSGLKISRYCDIWMSWLLRTVVDHMGDAVRFGKPAVQQDRNVHNLFKDLRDEVPGMELNETLINSCQSAKLVSRDYIGAYAELAQHIRRDLAGHSEGAFFQHLSDQMETWADAVAQVSRTDAVAAAA